MPLGTLILLLLAAYGIYRIFRFSTLPPVAWARERYRKLWGSKAGELFKCPVCLGTHIGVLLALTYCLPSTILIPILIVPATAASTFIIHYSLTLLDEVLALFPEEDEVK